MQTLNQGSTFTEGKIRFETMVRFAHAESMRSGKRVRIDFIQETNNAVLLSTNQLNQVKLSWEPNPGTSPDLFEELLSKFGVDQVNEVIRVTDVKFIDDMDDLIEPSEEETVEGVEPTTAITFNPDGACDNAEITLVGIGNESNQSTILRLDGITGIISTKILTNSVEINLLN